MMAGKCGKESTVFCPTCGKTEATCAGHLIEFHLPEKLCCIYADKDRTKYLASLLQILDPDTGLPFRPKAVKTKIDIMHGLEDRMDPIDVVNELAKISKKNGKEEPKASVIYTVSSAEEATKFGPIRASHGNVVKSMSGCEAKDIIRKACREGGPLSIGSKLVTLLGFDNTNSVSECLCSMLIASTVFILPPLSRPDRCISSTHDDDEDDEDSEEKEASYGEDPDERDDPDEDVQDSIRDLRQLRQSRDSGDTIRIKDPVTIASEQFYFSVLGSSGGPSGGPSRRSNGAASTSFVPKVEKVQAAFVKLCRSIEKRMDNKMGRVRGDILGTRVDMCARTVISGDPNISIGEVGIPIGFAIRLPVRDVVNRFNIGRIREMIPKGLIFSASPPSSGSRRHDRVYVPSNTLNPSGTEGMAGSNGLSDPKEVYKMIQPGWTVYRALWDGDRVVMNRQPTLHSASIMSHRARILQTKGLTLRLNPNSTDSYNADFDGDEMNLHVINPSAAADLDTMSVKNNIVTTQNSSPVICIKQVR